MIGSIKLNITDLARNLADFINRVSYRGERFVLYRGGKAVAELGPVTSGNKLKELPALLDSLPVLSVEEANSFIQDIDSARKDSEKLRDPWE